MTTVKTISNLDLLNQFRVADGKAPFGEWRKARHLPMLEAYIANAEAEANLNNDDTEEGDEPDALLIDTNGDTTRESELPVVADKKTPAYKVLARMSGATSTVEKPVARVHDYLSANPNLSRKEAIAALVEMGINYSTARTQYQKWFSKK